jgi:parallel beta-helix repeat protein
MRTIATVALFLCVSPLIILAGPGPEKPTLVCGGDKTISEFAKTLAPGATLVVIGTCNENVVLGPEVNGITLDGLGAATIHGGPSTNQTTVVTVTGRGITIKGFTITGGGQHGISVQDGGFAEINGNVIQGAARNGIVVFRNSTARIINNTIEGNPNGGINVGHTSSALIGFTGPPGRRVRAGNLIQNSSGGPGVQVVRDSHAQIFANTIQNNREGVLVERNAQVEVAACVITGNAQNAIRAAKNAGVDLGEDSTGSTSTFDDDVSKGTNGGFAVGCAIDGFVYGALGGLTGALGDKQFDGTCTDGVVP